MTENKDTTQSKRLPRQLVLNFDAHSSMQSLMTVDDIFINADEKLLKELHEDNRIERKPSKFSGSSLGEYISMWANTAPDGGIIVVGMRDKNAGGGFLGCEQLSKDSLNQLESCGATFCPDAKVETKRVYGQNIDGKDDFVVVFRVYYNESVVVKNTSGKAFHRIADSKYELKAERLRELQADKGEVSFEQQSSGLKWPDDFDMSSIKEFVEVVKAKRRLEGNQTVSEILQNRRLGRISRAGVFDPNMACALLFANDPQMVSPGCKVRFQRFDGDQEETGERYNAVKDMILEGTVPSLIVQVANMLESQLRSFSPLDEKVKFQVLSEYPHVAWYEAVVNACVHRSYGNGMKNMPVFVKMFNDRLEIESPGPFPPYVTPSNIYDTHSPRNPWLMDAMFYLEYVKCAHEGTRRIRDSMKEMKLPEPTFSQSSSQHVYVKVTLRNMIHQRVLSKRRARAENKRRAETNAASSLNEAQNDILFAELPEEVSDRLPPLGGRPSVEVLRRAILELCTWRPLLAPEIALYVKKRKVTAQLASLISQMVEEGLLEMTIPEDPTHRGQKYKSTPEGVQHTI